MTTRRFNSLTFTHIYTAQFQADPSFLHARRFDITDLSVTVNDTTNNPKYKRGAKHGSVQKCACSRTTAEKKRTVKYFGGQLSEKKIQDGLKLHTDVDYVIALFFPHAYTFHFTANACFAKLST